MKSGFQEKTKSKVIKSSSTIAALSALIKRRRRNPSTLMPFSCVA